MINHYHQEKQGSDNCQLTNNNNIKIYCNFV